ncbi:WAT1-related protein [Cardamine amara subsp. amara]|uniref:WAT1-related protein n=1 Tax=Cardamine amara subsp. amara TaxID=228776 RepID=A0ABD1A907_CARAN
MVKFDAKLWKAVFMMSMINIGLSVVNVMFKKMLDQGINRMVATTYRLAAGTLFLTPLAIFLERHNRPRLTGRILCSLFFSALLGTSLVQYFFLIGLQNTSSTFALAFSNMVPSVTFALALVFRQETLNIKSNIGRAKVFGTMICICGALILTLYKGTALTPQHSTPIQTQTRTDSTGATTQKWAMGSIMLVISISIWSAWFIVQAKISRAYPCQYTSTTILSFFGVIQSALLSLISERSISMWVVKDRFQVLSLLYSGIIGSGLCYVGMSWCLRQRGPVFTSSFIPLIQVFAAIFSFSFLHEQIYCGSVVGSMVIIVGLYILLWGKNKDKPSPVPKQEPLNLDLEGCGTSPKEVYSAAHPVSEKS